MKQLFDLPELLIEQILLLFEPKKTPPNTYSGYNLGKRSLLRLKGVHPDLVEVVERAISHSEIDFTVGQGLRTLAQQRRLVTTGKSQTMNSRHLTGHAVDLWPLHPVTGKVTWDWQYYYPMAKAMKHAAVDLGVDLKWGGDWTTFKDGPHFQLTWKDYP